MIKFGCRKAANGTEPPRFAISTAIQLNILDAGGLENV
jgi:hypothetical protein